MESKEKEDKERREKEKKEEERRKEKRKEKIPFQMIKATLWYSVNAYFLLQV